MNYYLENTSIEAIEKLLYEKELSDESKKLLPELHDLYSNYQYFYPERYEYPFSLKKEYFEPLLKGESYLKLDLSTVDKSNYSYEIFREILKNIRKTVNLLGLREFTEEEFRSIYSPEQQKEKTFNNQIFFEGEDLADYLEQNITIGEVLNNKINKEYRIGQKRFGEGAKLTRLLSGICDAFYLTNTKNHYVGNMVLDKSPDELYLSVHPFTGYMAGLISSSCLSPEGCNSHAGILYNGFPNTALIYKKDFSWRAFASFDFAAKRFSVYKGYPNEDYSSQFLIKKYFEQLGFIFVEYYFEYPSYFDQYSIFEGKEVKETNYDAYHSYDDENSITGISGGDKIAEAFYSEYNDNYSFDPDNEDDGMIWCDYEGSTEHSDYVYWSEFLESYVSEFGETIFISKNKEIIFQSFMDSIEQYIPEKIRHLVDKSLINVTGLAFDLLREDSAWTLGEIKKVLDSFNIPQESDGEDIPTLIENHFFSTNISYT